MTVKTDELSAYAPIRLRNQTSWQFARQLAGSGWITRDGQIGEGLYDRIEEYLLAPTIALAAQAVKDGELPAEAFGTFVAKAYTYNDWVPLAGQFETCGRQIFDLHDKLTELLSNTDLGECTLEDLHLPYDAFYLRFGKLDGIRRPFNADETGNPTEWEYLDGAFVATAPWDASGSRLKFGFSTVHEDASGVMNPGYFIDLLPEELKLPVPQAIETALKRRLDQLDPSPLDDSNTAALKQYQKFEVEEAAHLIRDAATMLINALFYLESIRKDLPPEAPGRDTPPERVSRWMQSQPAKRHKLRSGLTADGYALVRLVGSEVVHGGAVAATGASSTVRVHWRRGHWRFQAYGEGRALRKRIWIKPILVGRDHVPDAEPPGHIYTTSSTNTIQ